MDYIKTKDDFSMFKYDGIQAMKIGRLDYAMECFERALAIKDDVETHQYFAQALVSANDLEGAIEELECIREAEPENTNILTSIAELSFQIEDYEKMDEACAKALELNPALAMPHYLLAKKAFAKKEYIDAIAQTTLAISAEEVPEKKTEDVLYDAYILRCKTLLEMGQFAEAEKDIDKVLSQTEEMDETILLKAEICDGLGKNDEAEKAYRQVIELNPFMSDAYLKLGALMMKLGRKKEAEELAKEAMEYAPETMDDINGEYTNWEQKMKEYSAGNPLA